MFNDGQVSRLKMFARLGLHPGANQKRFARHIDLSHISKSNVKCSEGERQPRAKRTVNNTDAYYESAAFD